MEVQGGIFKLLPGHFTSGRSFMAKFASQSVNVRLIIDREVLSVNIVIEPVSMLGVFLCFFFVSTCVINARYNKI